MTKDKNKMPDQDSNGQLLAGNNKTADSADLVITADSAYLNEMANSLQVVLPASNDDLKAAIINLANSRAKAAAVQGYYCIALKERLGHGDYEAFLEGVGISLRRAREDVKIAQLIMKSPEESRAALLDFGKTKLMALAKLDDAVLNATLESQESLLDMMGMSVKELKSDIDTKKSEIYKLQNEKENLQHENKKLKEKRSYSELANQSAQPQQVVKARIEATQYQVQASVALTELEDDWLNYSLNDEDHDEPRNATLINQAYYFGAVQIYEQARAVLETFHKEGNEEYITAPPQLENYFKKATEEHKEVARAAAEIIEEFVSQKERRANLLANEYQTGAGRPRKVEDLR